MKNLKYWPEIRTTQFLFENCDHLNGQIFSSKETYKKACKSSLSGLKAEVEQPRIAVDVGARKKAVFITARARPKPITSINLGTHKSLGIAWENGVLFGELSAMDQNILQKYFLGETFNRGTVNTDDLLLEIQPMITAAVEKSNIDMPDNINFFVPVSDFGAHGFVPEYANYSTIFKGPIIVNSQITADGYSDKLKGTLLNEFSHVLTNRFFVKYIESRRAKGVGGEAKEILSNAFAGFSSDNIPNGNYSFRNYDELMSECFTHAVFPEQLVQMYASYGSGEVSAYRLSEDFLALHISRFLSEKYTGAAQEYSPKAIKDAFADLYEVKSNADAVMPILEKYHLQDANLLAYLQSKYVLVGRQLYDHLSDKIYMHKGV